MNEKELINYYNKFNEDKRLDTRHGKIEFITSITYLKKYLKKYKDPKIIDIGAGTGKYSIYLANLGYDVTAIELVKHNLKVLQNKTNKVKSYLGNALDLTKFKDESFDIVLLFGPMYHLISFDDKLKALKEAKRILKKNGLIFITYCMNEFPIIKHGFIDNHIKEEINNIDKNYHIINKDSDLYSFVRLEEINKLKKQAHLKRVKILSQDGCSEYIRKYLNKMDKETFDLFIDYHLKTCERKELLGSGRHILDILKKED